MDAELDGHVPDAEPPTDAGDDADPNVETEVRLTEVPGFRFVRGSIATNGLPSIGLSASPVSVFGEGVLREVTGQVSDPGHWYLVEGEAENTVPLSASMAAWESLAGAVTTLVPGDAPDGSDALRVQVPEGSNGYVTPDRQTMPLGSHVSFWLRASTSMHSGTARLFLSNPVDNVVVNPVPADWARIEFEAAMPTDDRHLRIGLGGGGGGVPAGVRDGVWAMVQIEAGSATYASSYIPTGEASRRRAADDLSVELPVDWIADELRVRVLPAWSTDRRSAAAVLLEGAIGALRLEATPDGMALVLETDRARVETSAVPIDAGQLVTAAIDWRRQRLSLEVDGRRVETDGFEGTWPVGQRVQIGATATLTNAVDGALSVATTRAP